jgi:hypothetical protein
MVIKYLDASSNGQQEGNELLLSGWTIEVFDSVTGDLIASDITDSAGTVLFDNLTPGSYTVCETLIDGWINPTGNLCVDVDVNVETITEVAFGNRQPIIPISECAITEADGTMTAYFGYENPNPVAITLPIGEQNQFAPAPAERGQPAVFEPGRSAPWPNSAVTIAGLTADVSWSLDGSTAQSTNTPCATRIKLEKVWLNADATETEPPFDLGLDELMIMAESDLGSAACGYQTETWVCTYINDPSAPDNDGLWVAAGDTYSAAESGAPDLWQPVEDTIGAGFDPALTCLDSTAQCVHIVQNAQTIPSSPPGTNFTPR